jgi:hypothetical protein
MVAGEDPAMAGDLRYQAFTSQAPKRIPHWENWSCPDAETYITGIDYYRHPRQCRQRMHELYPLLARESGLELPATDEPKPRPEEVHPGTSYTDEKGLHHVRWGDQWTFEWDWGRDFKTLDDVRRFSPLAQGDFRDIPVVCSLDYRDEEALYRHFRKDYPAEWGDRAPAGSSASCFFYNTMFMWPMLTFGWNHFLDICLEPEMDRLMEEFAEINRRVFRSFARLPVNFVICHDDITNPRGPVCSPKWLRKHIYPRYEEFWSIVKASGKQVIWMCDGKVDAVVDDVLACGAQGVITEPYTDFKALARRHPGLMMAGEGDNRVLTRNDPAEIEAMVRSMVETAQMTGGYMMSIGNHIPWNIPPDAVKRYLDLSDQLAWRR